MTIARRYLLALALVLAPAVVWSHGFAPTLLELVEHPGGAIDVRWKRPPSADADAGDGPTLRWPTGCRATDGRTAVTSADAVVTRGRARCDAPGLAGRTLEVGGGDAHGPETLVEVTFADGRRWSTVLRTGESAVALPATGGGSVARVVAAYARLGVEHIAGGADHLLFVLGLLLLARGWRSVMRTVTAFTVGHSVTLALSALSLVQVRQKPVEAVIALSIGLLAVEALRARDGAPGWTSRAPWAVAGGFGLLHGFGFAGALREVGLPPDRSGAALAGFNLGVEAGQLAFVAAALTVAAMARRFGDVGWGRRALAQGIGAAATYWALGRAATLLS